MKLHRNSYSDKRTGEHTGYSWHASGAEASKARAEARANGRKADGEIIEIAAGKKGLLIALGAYASYPDNG